MRSSRYKAIQLLSLPLVLTLILGAMGGGARQVEAEHATMPVHGMVCTTNPTATFTLTTKTGTISTPDGNIIYMWGFSEGDSPFQHPGPVLCVTEGQTVTVVVNNTLPKDVSLVFPGQESVMANGQISQAVFDGGGNLISLAPVAAANGGSVTYSFVASKPGTYIYQSGTEPLIQVNMGLFGALVVRPAANPDWAYNEIIVSEGITHTSQFMPDEEFVLMLSEIDPMLHMAVEQGLSYNMNNYRPRYWMINGRSFPDTIAPNGAVWLPNQPYGSLIHIYPFDDAEFQQDGITPNPAYHPYPALIRYLSFGTQDYPHHPHGNHGRVIAHDGNALVSAANTDMSYEDFTVLVGPGQTYDVLFGWHDPEQWDPVTNPIPVTIPQLQNLTFGTFYSGSPYLGATDTLPVGSQVLNACGEYYHISHNHALQQITAWGIVLSGHITFARIDPPLPNTCP